MQVVRLPVASWREYRSLRLRALKEDAAAFTSSYADAASQPDEYWQRRLAIALEGRDHWLLFAREADRLVGMIGAYIPEQSPTVAVVVSVYVPSEERRKGISRRLMLAILDILQARPELTAVRLGVNVTQSAAIALYEKFGFVEVSRAPDVTGEGRPVVQIEMERALRPE